MSFLLFYTSLKGKNVTIEHELNFFLLGMQLEMEEGDEIDAMLHQTGGGSN